MKIIVGLYVLFCWLLLKFGIVKKTLGAFVAMGCGGIFVLFIVLTGTRYFAFLDLTNSTTVQAPHIVLNGPAGGEIEKIFVTHNQRVKAGEPIFSFKTDRYEIQMSLQKAEKSRLETQLHKLEVDLKRLGKLVGEVVPQAEFDTKQAEVATQKDLIIKADETIAELQWKIDRAVIVAPVDGQVSVQFTSEGQYFGENRPSSIIMYTNKKFIQVRIPDQVYSYIKEKAFSEFYVDAYPGKIFRARVHSITESTGEAQGVLLPIQQGTGMFVGRNMNNYGRTVILEFEEPPGINIPVGATGSAWIATEKPIAFLGFLDAVIGMLLRFWSAEFYLKAL